MLFDVHQAADLLLMMCQSGLKLDAAVNSVAYLALTRPHSLKSGLFSCRKACMNKEADFTTCQSNVPALWPSIQPRRSSDAQTSARAHILTFAVIAIVICTANG